MCWHSYTLVFQCRKAQPTTTTPPQNTHTHTDSHWLKLTACLFACFIESVPFLLFLLSVGTSCRVKVKSKRQSVKTDCRLLSECATKQQALSLKPAQGQVCEKVSVNFGWSPWEFTLHLSHCRYTVCFFKAGKTNLKQQFVPVIGMLKYHIM